MTDSPRTAATIRPSRMAHADDAIPGGLGAGDGGTGRDLAEPTDAQAIALEGLTLRYAGATQLALDDIDLVVRRGAIVAIVGPSGCGKSTLLKVVAGLLPPSSGRVLLDGADASSLPAARRQVGWVPQSYGLFDHLDVAGNVAFGLGARGVPRSKRATRVGEVLRLGRIADLATRHVAELSGGQRQRVAIARALAPEPSVLLLDEPLAALDPQLRAEIRGELAALLRRSGVTTLLVTHDQNEALALADQVLVLRAGRVEQLGTPLELWERPATAFVASFVSAATTVSGRLAGDEVEVAAGLRLAVDTRTRPASGQVEIALRADDLVVSSHGAEAEAATCEYLGGAWQVTATLRARPELTVPAVATAPVEPGTSLHVAARPGARCPILPAAPSSADEESG